MSTTHTDPIADVLNVVRGWPPAQRISLTRQLLEIVSKELDAPPPRKKSVANLMGRLKEFGPAPDAKECDKILEEELVKKHVK
jgi:hypothetical protein